MLAPHRPTSYLIQSLWGKSALDERRNKERFEADPAT